MPRKKQQHPESYNTAFPANLRELMEKTGTTQIELGNSIGVSRQSISYYCDGSSSPTWEGIVAIANYFDVSVDWLLGLPGSVQRADTDLNAVCKYTGLSSASARRIHGNTENGRILSQIIEDPRFPILINSIAELLRYKALESRSEYKEDLEQATADEEFAAYSDMLNRHYYRAIPLADLKDLEEAKTKKAFAHIIESLRHDWAPQIDLYPDKHERAIQKTTPQDLF